MRLTYFAFLPKCRNLKTLWLPITRGVAVNLYFGVLCVELKGGR